jgi:flagellar basal-body rod modification protein FlgD
MAISAITAMAAAATQTTNKTETNNKTDNTDTKKTASSTDATNATLNYESFLKLLITQMQNQDPTDPLDASEQMSQLASFSVVEQNIKMNSNLESLIQQTTLSQASSLIGQNITSADGKTTGIVKSVEINSDGLTAILEDGSKVVVQTGITVGKTPETDTDTNTDTQS